jgi:hypothetical protein
MAPLGISPKRTLEKNMRKIILSAVALAFLAASPAAFAATTPKPAPKPAVTTSDDVGTIASLDAAKYTITLTDSSTAGKTTFKLTKTNWTKWKVATTFKVGDKVDVTYKIVGKNDDATAIKAAP